MKKWMLLLLTMALLLGAAALAEAPTVVGVWYMIEDPEGMAAIVEFAADGTARLTQGTESAMCTWRQEADGTVTITWDGHATTLTWDGAFLAPPYEARFARMDPALMGGWVMQHDESATLQLNADGTAQLVDGGMTAADRWYMQDDVTVIVPGVEVSLTVTSDGLSLGRYLFIRSDAEVVQANTGFVGLWAGADGTQGVEILPDGTARLFDDGQDTFATWVQLTERVIVLTMPDGRTSIEMAIVNGVLTTGYDSFARQ